MSNEQSFIERWAQALVKNALDVVAAFDEVYPYDGITPNGKVKSAKRKQAIFNEHWSNRPALWLRVAELQRKVDAETVMQAEELLNQWTVIANTDRRDMVAVATITCPVCDGSGEHADAPCGRCFGSGNLGQGVKLKNTEDYTPEEALCYEGAKQTKHGIELITTMRETARQNIARYHGLFNDKLQAAKNNELPPAPPLPDDPHEAARAYTDWVKQ